MAWPASRQNRADGYIRQAQYICLDARGLQRLYVSAESGDVTVFRENGKALVTEGAVSMPHAHTVCVDPETHLVYFPLESVDGRPVLRIMQPSQGH